MGDARRERLAARPPAVRGQQIDLVQHQPALSLGELGAELLELRHHRARIRGRIARPLHRRHVHQMQQQPGAREMLEKTDAEAGTLRRTLDQAGHVGDHEAAIGRHLDHTEMRMERGERIVGHLGPRRRNRADEGRLAGVRQTHQSHIGEQPELEIEIAALSRLPGGGLTRRPVGAALEARVAEAVVAAPRHHQLVLGRQQLADDLSGIRLDRHRTDRHANAQIGPAAPRALLPAPVLAALGAIQTLIAEVHQRVQVGVGDEQHIPTVPTVAAIGATLGNVLLAPEAQTAVAAAPGLDAYRRLVDEFHDPVR